LLDIIDWSHQEDGKPIVPPINFYTTEKVLELSSKLDINEIKVMFFISEK